MIMGDSVRMYYEQGYLRRISDLAGPENLESRA